MQLKLLRAQSFLGLDEAEIEFDKPVTLFVGGNNQGKSSVKDALLFALTGKARALTKFKDVNKLRKLHGNGFEVGLDYLDDSGAPCAIVRNGQTGGSGADGRAILRYCLNPVEFIALPARDRGAVLAEVLGGGLDEIVKAAIVKHIGNVNQTVLAEIKGSGTNILDVEAFKSKTVELRRQYKRQLDSMPKQPPLPGDYGVDRDYDPAEDTNAVANLKDRISKGGELIAALRQQQQIKAGIIDTTRQIEELENQRVKVPKIPDGVSVEETERAMSFFAMLEESLNQSDAKSVKCPVCLGSKTREKMQERMSSLVLLVDSTSALVAEHENAKKHNADIEAQIARLSAELKSLNQKSKPIVDAPAGSESLLQTLQNDRDRRMDNLKAHERYLRDLNTYHQCQSQAKALGVLIAETNRIDDALKDGGPVKAYISQHGRKLPINAKLLQAWGWGTEDLEWSDAGDIWLHGIEIEYASDSERYRVACVMGLALADISKIGVAAIDGLDILLPENRNAFFSAIRQSNISNVLVFCSSDKQYNGETRPDWLDIFLVEKGRVAKV